MQILRRKHCVSTTETMNRIYLVGYMGAGKTTVARRIAQRLGWEVADTDALFEAKYRISVDNFFHKYDETLYRKLESQVLKETESLENVVISTGGGTPCHFDNMEWMNQHGLTVFLQISSKAAVDRLLHSKRKRPLIEGKTEAELTEFVTQHYASRLPFYERAQMTMKAENFDMDGFIKLIENEQIASCFAEFPCGACGLCRKENR